MSLSTRVDRDPSVASSASRARLKSGTRPTLVAIDLGAESCRVSLLQWTRELPNVRLVHRFSNAPVNDGRSLRWDLRRICDGIDEGLRACAELAPEGISAIGVDGWAVDYVYVDSSGQPIANPFCYRDERTVAAKEAVLAHISAEDLYKFTGVQLLPLNTLYQLYADKSENIPAHSRWMNLPEFILNRLGGERVSEYTNASNTQMLRVDKREWCEKIFAVAELDLMAAPRIVAPGTVVGRFKGALAMLPTFRNTKLIAPACHDTASAIAGIPVHGNNWAFISSGTWSLVGCVLDAPCLDARARQSNFSNEGGVGGKINFLKNVNGMWLLQQCMQHWAQCGEIWSITELLRESSALPRPSFTIDVDDPDLLLPGDMPARINAQLARAGIPAVSEAPAIANLIFHSLAAKYAALIRDVESITGKHFEYIYVVGGGSKNALLNRLTMEATGLKVVVGPSESATVGNFAVQLAVLSGQYTEHLGAEANAVAHWAGEITGYGPVSGIGVSA